MKSIRLHNLTAARFFAALLVFLHHAHTVFVSDGIPAAIQRFVYNGYCGVTFFFIVSGFVIAFSSYERFHRFIFRDVLNFFGKRIARVAPVLLFLALPMIVADLRDGRAEPALWRFLSFTQAWSGDLGVAFAYLSVAWTLSCEIFFYAMFPLLAFVVARTSQRWPHAVFVAIGLCCAVPLIAALVFQTSPELLVLGADDPRSAHRWLYRCPALRFAEFTLGVCLCVVFLRYRDVIRRSSIWLPIFVVALVALVTAMAVCTPGPLTWTAVYVIPFGLLVFALAAMEIAERPIAFGVPVLILLGEASYAFYLVHQQYVINVFRPIAGAWVDLLWALVFTVTLSIGLFLTIENPVRRWLYRWLSLLSGQPSRQSELMR